MAFFRLGQRHRHRAALFQGDFQDIPARPLAGKNLSGNWHRPRDLRKDRGTAQRPHLGRVRARQGLHVLLQHCLPTMSERLNEGYEYREKLGPDADARTVLAYLSQRYQSLLPDRVGNAHCVRSRADRFPARAFRNRIAQGKRACLAAPAMDRTRCTRRHFPFCTKTTTCLPWPNRRGCPRFPAVIS